MRTHMRQMAITCILSAAFLISEELQAQVYSNKDVGKKHEKAIDSIKASDYPYLLPIMGKRVTKLGFDLPYSAGLGINYLWQESDIVINNLQVGFNNRPMQNVDEIIRFDDAKSTATGLNFRPDIWLFPFLNVYGILARSQPSTAVAFGAYIPDTNGNWNQVISMNSEVNFEATTMGFGLTPTIGVAGGWFALDMNFTWSDIPQLKDPAFAFVFGPRLGKTFKFNRPESNIAFWVGGFRLRLNTGTNGSLPLNEVIDTDGLQEKVDLGIQRVEEGNNNLETWWSGLTALEKKNPVNKTKYEMATRAISKAGSFLANLDNSLNDEEHASVQYALDKKPKDMWNFIVGTQYQHNKHFMLRLEYGFLGSRNQVIAGLQYRFRL